MSKKEIKICLVGSSGGHLNHLYLLKPFWQDKNRLWVTFLAVRILYKERPDVIISSGAAVAIPFFYLGKIFGAKTVYIEVFDRVDGPTMTGKIVYPVTDRFIVQWEEMKKVYPKAINLGGIF